MRGKEMSTKATISYDETYHLFEECFDDEHIYLGIEPKSWIFDGKELELEMTFDQWNKIVLGWLSSRSLSAQDRMLYEQAINKHTRDLSND